MAGEVEIIKRMRKLGMDPTDVVDGKPGDSGGMERVSGDGLRAMRLLEELLLTNFIYQPTHQGGYRVISPLNAEEESKRLVEESEIVKKRRRELLASLNEVRTAIENEGGISLSTYERRHYVVNRIARDLARLRVWGSSLVFRCEREDREGKIATPRQNARFPEDGDFPPMGSLGGHVNIFDVGNKISDWEGALFYPLYGSLSSSRTGSEIEVLESLRIFYQYHRDRLSVRTVKADEIVKEINSTIAKLEKGIAIGEFNFPLDKGAYLEKIAEFNRQFGRIAILEVLEGDRVAVRLRGNPKEVAVDFMTLGYVYGVPIKTRKGPVTWDVSRKAGGVYEYVDLLLPRHLKGDNEPFAPQKDKDKPTFLLPYRYPEFVVDLIGMMVDSAEKAEKLFGGA